MLYMLYVLYIYIYTYYLETICPSPGSTEVYQIPPASSSTGTQGGRLEAARLRWESWGEISPIYHSWLVVLT